MIGESNNGTNFPLNLLITDRQVSKLLKAFANNSSTNIKLSKTQLYKVEQSGKIFPRILRPLLKTGIPLMKNVTKPLAKSVLIRSSLTASASATEAGIYKKILGPGSPSDVVQRITTLIIWNKEIKDMKIVKSLEEYSLLIGGVSKTIENEATEQNRAFLSMLWGTLSARLLDNLLIGKNTIRAGKGTIRARQDV